MSFYDDICNYYDEIFPLKSMRTDFVSSFSHEGVIDNILDIGCATGELPLALARKGHRVTGIDLDEKMIAMACHKASKSSLSNPPNFYSRDMRSLLPHFNSASFHMVLCFGNTLPHLKGEMEVRDFVRQSYALLKQKGILILQVVNFEFMERTLKHELPLIETRRFIFERSYEYDSPQQRGRVLFCSSLKLKENNSTIENCVPLYPVSISTLKCLLKDAGFKDLTYLENESQKTFTPDSPSLIAIARK